MTSVSIWHIMRLHWPMSTFSTCVVTGRSSLSYLCRSSDVILTSKHWNISEFSNLVWKINMVILYFLYERHVEHVDFVTTVKHTPRPTPLIRVTTHYDVTEDLKMLHIYMQYRGHICLRFSKNSDPSSSTFLELLE